MIASNETLECGAFGTHCSRLAVARMQPRLVRPRKDDATQRHQALCERFRRGRMARSTRKDSVTHQDLAFEPQAATPWCVTRYMSDLQPLATNLHLHAIHEGKISLNAERLGVGRMQTHRSLCSQTHFLKRSNVITMGMSQKDTADRGLAYRRHDGVGIRAWVDYGHLVAGSAVHQIAVHGPGAYLQAFEIQGHGHDSSTGASRLVWVP
jgi:hypothetical protein